MGMQSEAESHGTPRPHNTVSVSQVRAGQIPEIQILDNQILNNMFRA